MNIVPIVQQQTAMATATKGNGKIEVSNSLIILISFILLFSCFCIGWIILK